VRVLVQTVLKGWGLAMVKKRPVLRSSVIFVISLPSAHMHTIALCLQYCCQTVLEGLDLAIGQRPQCPAATVAGAR
jgi:hypothetical protein